jgi:hypothetical protein
MREIKQLVWRLIFRKPYVRRSDLCHKQFKRPAVLQGAQPEFLYAAAVRRQVVEREHRTSEVSLGDKGMQVVHVLSDRLLAPAPQHSRRSIHRAGGPIANALRIRGQRAEPRSRRATRRRSCE